MNEINKWWQTGIIYQIYPRSFQDSNGDGVGDLPGIRRRLDYVKSLGVQAIWLSPIYPSPMHDFGYDVADYVGIDPMFGTMADFDDLLAAAHERELKLILDLVPNHTSDEHPWFQESRQSRDNPKRDWYIWRDPAPDGGPPNNWLSFFGGPAWTLDEQTGQYYLHQFVRQQPELNYRNPAVLAAMLDVMRFWLDKGVDGFRVDVIWLMMKDIDLRDEPLNPEWDGVEPHHRLLRVHTGNLPEVHGIIRQMRAVLDEYDERMMVGELYLPNDALMEYYGRRRPDGTFDECHLPYNFQLITTPWDAAQIDRMVRAYERVLPEGAWPNWVLGNHDQHRIATRAGYDQARVANMLLLTLRGTPTTYYGEELGLENVAIPPEMVQDPPAVNQPELAHVVGRDPERTPMAWDGSEGAGFTTGEPWLPPGEKNKQRSVARQEEDATSMLNFYRALTTLRQAEPALHAGHYHAVDSNVKDVMAYRRTLTSATSFLIVLNFSGEEKEVHLDQMAATATIALDTGCRRQEERVALAGLQLAGNEGLILRLPA